MIHLDKARFPSRCQDRGSWGLRGSSYQAAGPFQGWMLHRVGALRIYNNRSFILSLHSGDGNQGERKDKTMIAWLQKIANSMTTFKKWLYKGLNAIIIVKNAFKWAHRNFMKVFCNHLFVSFEKLISSLRCVWLNCKIPINCNLFVYLAIIFSTSLKHREYSE